VVERLKIWPLAPVVSNLGYYRPRDAAGGEDARDMEANDRADPMVHKWPANGSLPPTEAFLRRLCIRTLHQGPVPGHSHSGQFKDSLTASVPSQLLHLFNVKCLSTVEQSSVRMPVCVSGIIISVPPAPPHTEGAALHLRRAA
jgi:hypothetical protein